MVYFKVNIMHNMDNFTPQRPQIQTSSLRQEAIKG